MDIVYLYKKRETGKELRYSLRSLENLEHDKVYICGENEAWTKNVIYLPNPRLAKSKQQHALENLLKALAIQNLSTNFILMHDDMYIMKPVDKLDIYNRGTYDDTLKELFSIVGKSLYHRRCEMNQQYLRESLNIKNPLSYHLHIPMIFNKTMLKESIEKTFLDRPGWWQQQYQSIYFNRYGIKGKKIRDVKLRPGDSVDLESVFLSSGDESFKVLEPILAERFSSRSNYELS